jgi:hypothetical protein
MISRLLFGFAAMVAAGALAACGGDKDTGSSNPPAGVLEQVDLSQSVQTLQQLKSFRFELTMKVEISGPAAEDPLGAALLGALANVEMKGAYVAPDSFEAQMKMFGEDIGIIQIGDTAWVKAGGSWEATDAEDLGLEPDFDELLTDVLPAEVLDVAKTSREKVNGVETVKYSWDKAALAQLMESLGETADLSDVDQASLSIWMMDDVVPVKMTMSFAGKDEDGNAVSLKLDFTLKDINDPGIKIRPPA